MAETAMRLIISGRVQGVGFRYWMERKATALGLVGWVRNLPDGRVEALIAGSADAVREMAVTCRQGPRMAQVTDVQELAADMPAEAGFRQFR